MSQNKTVVQLRAELKALGLSTKGNKAELETRLAEATAGSADTEKTKGATAKEEHLENPVDDVEEEKPLKEDKIEKADETSNIKASSQENERDRKRVKVDSESPGKQVVSVSDQLNQAKTDTERVQILLGLLFDPSTQKEAISHAKSNLLLFRMENGLLSSYEALLCQIEIDSKEEAEELSSSYYERAGMLQKIAFQCGVMDCALGAPSTCVQTAIQRNFFLDKANAHSLFCKFLGVSDTASVSKEVLQRALLRYFTKQEDELIESDFQRLIPPPIDRTLLASITTRPANSLRQLLIRLIFHLKLELVHPQGRLERVFSTSQVPKETIVIAKVKDSATQVKIGRQLKGSIVNGWTPLDRLEDEATLDRLEKVQGLINRRLPYVFERSLLHKITNDSTTKSAIVDFGHCFPNGLSQLKECFPDEIDSKLDLNDQQQQQTDRFVVTFNRKKGATVIPMPCAPQSTTTVARANLHPAQIRALRECLTAKQIAYVHGPANTGKTELASQLVATLATVHRRARILVVSGRSASHAADVLHRSRERAFGLLDVNKMVVACSESSNTTFFSPSRCVQRLVKERTRVLEQCTSLAKEMNVDDPSQSGRTCEFAHNFLVQAMKLETSQEKLDELVRLKTKVDDLQRFELFLSRPKEAQRFVMLSHCRIVGCSIDSLDQVGNHFDYIVADDVYAQEQLILIGSIFDDSSSADPILVCFGRRPQPEFAVESTASLSSVPLLVPRFVPGLSRSFTRKSVASLKEEAELAAGCFKYLTKIGYEPQDIRLLALSSKQCRSLEELVAKELTPFPPAIYGPEIPSATHPVRVVIVALGGAGREKKQQQVVDELMALRTDALIVLSSDREWIKQKVNIPNEFRVREDPLDMGDENDMLELVLGERLGEAFDEELRSSTKYPINKWSDLTNILANL